MKRALISWSGGKDSCFALQRSITHNIKPVALITVMNEEGTFSKSNGVSKDILSLQAKNLELPITFIPTSWECYEKDLLCALIETKSKYNADYCIFGDIDIESHRLFEEKLSAKAGLIAELPLWGTNRNELASEEINSGIKAKVSVINKTIMPEELLGVDYSEKIFPQLRSLNIDLLGENGEFHTLVYDCPLFKDEIDIITDNFHDIQDYKLMIFKPI